MSEVPGARAVLDDGCPCGSGALFGACCGPVLDGARPARTAEELMRSRYTAFVRGDVGHLVRSWHPRTRPAEVDPGERSWTRLEILRTEAGGPEDDEGVVEFRAHYARPGRPGGDGVQHEVSRFVRRGGRWVYLDAAR